MSLREDFARSIKASADRHAAFGFNLRYWQLVADDLLARYAIEPRPDITITRAVQTCSAWPSQWDAWDQNGEHLYLRFRHGHGTARREGGDRELVAEFSTGGDDGVISLEDFARRAGLRLAEGVW